MHYGVFYKQHAYENNYLIKINLELLLLYILPEAYSGRYTIYFVLIT